MSRYHKHYDEHDDEEEDCGGFNNGCEGCDSCTDKVSSRKHVIARIPRNNILPGDLVAVTTGFTFQKDGGPRLGYFESERRIARGPAHGPSRMGLGWHNFRGGFAKRHPEHADMVEERDALNEQVYNLYYKAEGDIEAWNSATSAWEDKYDTQYTYYPYRNEPLARQDISDAYHAKIQAQKDAARNKLAHSKFHSALHAAKYGDIVISPENIPFRYCNRTTRLKRDRMPQGCEGDYAEAFGVHVMQNLNTGFAIELRP